MHSRVVLDCGKKIFTCKVIPIRLLLLFFLVNFWCISVPQNSFGQASHENEFKKEDSIRGGITPERAWWDLQHYHLSVTVDPVKKTISGSNTMTYKVTGDQQLLQIDLQEPMILEKVIQNQEQLIYLMF